METIQGFANDERIQNIGDGLVALARDSFPEDKMESMEDMCGKYGTHAYWIAICTYGRPIAMVMLAFEETGVFLCNLCVLSTRRRENLGAGLFYHVKNYVGDNRIGWWVDRNNMPAISFYKKQGAIFTTIMNGDNIWCLLN